MKPGWRLQRLARGSRTVAKRTGRAFVPLDPDGEIRLIASGLRITAGAALGNGLLNAAHQSPLWLTGGTCLWCWASWRAGAAPAKPAAPAEEEEEESAGAEQVPVDGPGEPSPEDLRAAVVQRLLDWVGDRRGIHLAEVYERYRQLPGHQHLTDAQIRAALVDHYAVPVRPAVRIGDKVARGIHRDDLQPLPSPATDAPVADERNTAVTSTVAA
jgi:hypothetical protein